MGATSAAVRIESSEQAAALFAPTFSHGHHEELRVAHLDHRRCLIALRLHGGGSTAGFDLPLEAIVREALVLGSRAMLLAHSHPSGDPTPSRADVAATRALAEVIGLLGINLYDHLVFAGDQWRSLLALGLL